ncbi:hypothetical protein Tco_0541763, partial [Tanacetum coccineum]
MLALLYTWRERPDYPVRPEDVGSTSGRDCKVAGSRVYWTGTACRDTETDEYTA